VIRRLRDVPRILQIEGFPAIRAALEAVGAERAFSCPKNTPYRA